jgi:hypothetical protein
MAKLLYVMNASLDGYIADEEYRSFAQVGTEAAAHQRGSQ